MAERKVVQIAVAGHAENSFTQSEFTLIALANDGTLWGASNRNLGGDCDAVWQRITGLPS